MRVQNQMSSVRSETCDGSWAEQTVPTVLNRRHLGSPTAPLPPNSVYIGRKVSRGGYKLQASKWANPFKIGRDGTREEVIAKYREYVLQRPELMAALHELRGKNLVCWCAPKACHGCVLIELLSSSTPS